jgi:hypothetical protein
LSISAPNLTVSAPNLIVSALHANHTTSNMKNYCLFWHQFCHFRHQFCARCNNKNSVWVQHGLSVSIAWTVNNVIGSLVVSIPGWHEKGSKFKSRPSRKRNYHNFLQFFNFKKTMVAVTAIYAVTCCIT